MDSKAMIAAWKKTISPGEAARVRAITAPVAERLYSAADW
jgi:hypothetical protein